MLRFLNFFPREIDQLLFYCDQHLLGHNAICHVHKAASSEFLN